MTVFSAGRSRRVSRVLAGTALAAVFSVHAGNGLNDVGYGSESAGMAGADLAIARDTAALNTNPAGLAQTEHRVFDLLLEPYSFLRTGHKDELGNDQGPSNRDGVAMGGGYAQRLNERLVVGVGFFFQGGAGFAYEGLQSRFGEGDLSSIFGSVKLAPGLAWQASDRLRLGAALGINYSSARQKQLFEVSTPEFSGARIDSLSGLSTNFKLGLQYELTPEWLLALAYTSKAPLKLDNGEMRVNATASGASILRYRDVSVRGLAFAPEIGVGLRWQPGGRWLWTAELNWLDWSSSMQQTTLVARDPAAPGLPDQRISTPLDWRDQWLAAAGGIFRWTPRTEIIFGASHARQPIPRHTLGPTFALLGETSLSMGLTHQLDANWRFVGGATWQPPVRMRHDDPLFGASRETWEATGVYLTLNRRW